MPEPFEVPVKTLAGRAEPPPEADGLVLSERILDEMGYEGEALDSLIGRQVALVLHAPRGESQSLPLVITGITTQRYGDADLALPDRLAMLEWWYSNPDYLNARDYDEVVIRAASLNDAANIVDWLSQEGYKVQSL